MSNSISATGFFISNTSLIQNSETILQTLSDQLNTGKKSTDLVGDGTDASTIINLNDTVNQTQAYVNNSTHVGTTLSAYDTTLTQLQKDATQLQKAIGTVGANTPDAVANLTSVIQGLQVDVTATLNTQIGNRFLYSGTRFGTQPVIDLTTLAVPAAPSAFTPVVPLTVPLGGPFNSPLPNYDTQSPSTDPNNQAYATQTVNISDTSKITYGVTSNDPSIQALVFALQQAKAGAAAPQPQQAQFFANANAALQTALTGNPAGVPPISGLQGLQQNNAENQVEVKTEQTTQKQAIGNLQVQLGNLQNIDPATVATQLTAVENQLQGSFKITSSILGLSLLDFIK
jgi:hypothetical protein